MAEEECKTDIAEPHPHDILLGRGNLSNRHPGNEHFRSLVNSYKLMYVVCPKSQKAMYPKIIYDRIQEMDPPGRFLKQDPITKLWSTVDKKKAIDKTRQALREGAPDLLKGLEGKEDENAASSRIGARVSDDTNSLHNFKNTNPFTAIQNQRSSNHRRFLSDVSIDASTMSSFNFPTEHLDSADNAGNPQQSNNRSNFISSSSSEALLNSSSQFASGNVLNTQIQSEAELSSMLRTAQMQMIQRHINEWQQLSNIRGAMQSTGYVDAQLQLQALNMQLQLQNAWNEALQHDGNGSNQQQSFTFGNPQGINPSNNSGFNLNTQPQNTPNTSEVQTAQSTSNALPYAQQQAITGNTPGNVPDFSSFLAALQNNTSASDSSNSYTNHAMPDREMNQHDNLKGGDMQNSMSLSLNAPAETASTTNTMPSASQTPSIQEQPTARTVSDVPDFSAFLSSIQNNATSLNKSNSGVEQLSQGENDQASLYQQLQSHLLNSKMSGTSNNIAHLHRSIDQSDQSDASNRNTVAKSA